MRPNFTFIIPHKNSPELLRRCIKSIPNRGDVEIIIVDDNSSPDIVDFEHFPGCDRENTTIIFDKAARGAGHARNVALEKAQGKWIIFSDADDFFHETLSGLLDMYVDSEADVIYFNADSVDSTTLRPAKRTDHLHDFFAINKSDKKEGEKYFRYMFTEPWCKIIRHEIIQQHSIRFPEIRRDEDVRFANNIGLHAQSIIIDETVVYCVTDSQTSLCKSSSKKDRLTRFYVIAEWQMFLIDHSVDIKIPDFDYMTYLMTRKLYREPKAFCTEYHLLRKAGFSRRFIGVIILSNLWLNTKLKLKQIQNGYHEEQ